MYGIESVFDAERMGRQKIGTRMATGEGSNNNVKLKRDGVGPLRLANGKNIKIGDKTLKSIKK